MRASVVIPCYRPDANFEKMLGDLNAQTCQDFDVVLADDGNTPPLEARIEATLNRPHRIIRFDQNRGIVAGLNACIAAVSAPVVIRMDADDRMPPDRIARQLTFLDNHPDVDVVGASMAVFGSGLRMWTKPASHQEQQPPTAQTKKSEEEQVAPWKRTRQQVPSRTHKPEEEAEEKMSNGPSAGTWLQHALTSQPTQTPPRRTDDKGEHGQEQS